MQQKYATENNKASGKNQRNEEFGQSHESPKKKSEPNSNTKKRNGKPVELSQVKPSDQSESAELKVKIAKLENQVAELNNQVSSLQNENR